jgi:hypothetical protein
MVKAQSNKSQEEFLEWRGVRSADVGGVGPMDL